MFSVYYDPFLVAAAQQVQAQAAANSIQATQVDQNYRLQVRILFKKKKKNFFFHVHLRIFHTMILFSPFHNFYLILHFTFG